MQLLQLFDVLQILSYFHKHKKQRGVDAMLLKLYDPILWRSFKVNASVIVTAAYYSLNQLSLLQLHTILSISCGFS